VPKSKTQEQAYDQCVADGMFLPQNTVELARIKAMLVIAEEDVASITDLKVKGRWNTLYKLSYDVLHTLAEALILHDKVKCANHQCLFAYLCTKHPELELDWNFFERLRTRRNGIHYYGETITAADYKASEVQLTLYIKTLHDALMAKTH